MAQTTPNELECDPPSDDDFVGPEEKKSIPDEILWKMFNTSVSFRTLSEILKLAFKVVNAENRFFTSPAYLFQRYKKMMESREDDHRAAIENDKSLGTICFDHQKMPMLNEKLSQKENRVAIVWHSNGKDKLLAVEKIEDKSGFSQSVAIQRICENFQIRACQIVALTCDNASTNIGQFTGACTLLEDALEQDFLRTNCRRRISEIVIKDVYHYFFHSDTPDNLFFSILKEKWATLRARNFPYAPFDSTSFAGNFDEDSWRSFQEFEQNALFELKLQSGTKNIRGDYKESNNVCLKFFGEIRTRTKSNQVEFRSLIQPTNSRFMATLIQGMECYLFREVLDWESPSRQEIKNNIERFAAFVALVYIRYWNRCTILFDSPFNDLKFLQELQIYSQFDRDPAQVAIAALNRHSYYMSEELSVLSLFSDKVSIAEKNHIAATLIEMKELPTSNSRIDKMSNHFKFSIGNERTDWHSMRIHDLIGERSLFLFESLEISIDFLENDAEIWSDDLEYIQAKEKISNTLVCINDTSERMISLCKTKNRNQRCRNEDSFRRSLYASSSKNND